MTNTNSTTETLTIRITSKDKDRLNEIAKVKNRRLNDFLQVILAEGLYYFFCDEHVHVKKLPEDYTPNELKQLTKNAEIDAIKNLKLQEKRDKGWRPVCEYLHNSSYNHMTGENDDPLIQPIVERIKAFALE
jgi:hypothetical protein